MSVTPYDFGAVFTNLETLAADFSAPVISAKTTIKAAVEAAYGGISLNHRGLNELSYAENATIIRDAAADFATPGAVDDPVVDAQIDTAAAAVAQKIYDALDDLATTNAVPLGELVALLTQPERAYVPHSLEQFRLRRTARLIRLQNNERELLDAVGNTGARGVPGSLTQQLAKMFSEAELEDSADLLALQQAYNAEEAQGLDAVMRALNSGTSSAATGVFRLGVQAFLTQREVALSLRQAQYDLATALLTKSTEVDNWTDRVNTILQSEIRRRFELDAQRKKTQDLSQFTTQVDVTVGREKIEAAQRLLSQVNNMVKLSVSAGLSQTTIPLGWT